MKIIQRLILAFTHGPEWERLLAEKKKESEEIERRGHKYNLNLCLKHKQERNQSHHSEHNCDYCLLLLEKQAAVGKLKQEDDVAPSPLNYTGSCAHCEVPLPSSDSFAAVEVRRHHMKFCKKNILK